MNIVDAQVHVWEPEPADAPWPEGAHEAAARHRPALGPDELIALMDEAGVDRAVLVPPFFQGHINGYAIDAARAHPDRFRVMARLDVQAADREQQLNELLAEPMVAGLRFVLNPRAGIVLADPALDWFWPIASERNIAVAFHVPGQIDGVAQLARKYPDLRLTVDHLGLGGASKDAELANEITTLVSLSQFANVSVKMTSVSGYSSEDYPYPTLQPFLQQVFDAFGPQRSFWGSDLTRLRGSYRELVSLFVEELSFLNGADLEAVMGESMSTWLGWPAPA